jgi:hypothetical protein
MNNKMIELPKGGIIINTKAGAIQFGVPPETIKDSLALNISVPSMYIATKNLFSHKAMASFIDLEFPVYYNFFMHRKKISVCCTESQKIIIEGIIKESFFGPEKLNLDVEFVNGKNNPLLPDMRKEMDYFLKHPDQDRAITIDDIIDFVILKDRTRTQFNGINVTLDIGKNSVTVDDGEAVRIPWDLDYAGNGQKNSESIENSNKVFLPPIFGITTLGSSHGFDPKGKTSGFIFWINGTGIMIDPPIDSAMWLSEENVDPLMVNSVILTHCHADHDSGVMQKILQEGRVTLYTTPTVFSSFIRKTSLLTGLSEIDVMELIDFIPVTIGMPMNINGATVNFSYRLHSIPTIGFEVLFHGKTVVYTSDHLNDHYVFDRLHREGVLTDGRYKDLKEFNWNKDIIIHEAGVPPLHTPLDILLELPEDIKKNIYLVHTDKSKIPVGSSLTISPTGLSNTMVIKIYHSIHNESIQILNLIGKIDIFDGMKFDKGAEFLSIIKYRKFAKGDCLIKEGEPGKRFYIIVAGKAKIVENGHEKAVLSCGSFFGESAIILNQDTTHSIYALTELITISIDRPYFLSFISNTNSYEHLKLLANVRNHGSWEAIAGNNLFNTITVNQKNYLESLLDYRKSAKNEIILKSGKTPEFSVLWNRGNAAIVDRKGRATKSISSGDFIGGPQYLLGEVIPENDLVSLGEGDFFMIEWNKMLKFYQKNPKVLFELKEIVDL